MFNQKAEGLKIVVNLPDISKFCSRQIVIKKIRMLLYGRIEIKLKTSENILL